MCDNDGEYGDQVDPRVQIELERLNNATDKINKLELDLDEARATFRNLLCESTARVDALRLKLGMCVERCKPYYEARFHANEALKQTQIAAMRYCFKTEECFSIFFKRNIREFLVYAVSKMA